jgi:hypothetical protein
MQSLSVSRRALYHLTVLFALVFACSVGLFRTGGLAASGTFTSGDLALLVASASANNTTARHPSARA